MKKTSNNALCRAGGPGKTHLNCLPDHLGASLAISLLFMTGTIGADVVPVGATFAGTTYEELVVPWWDWGLNSGPLGANPIQDPTGAFAKVNQGQHNPLIFWLAGSFGIPEGPRIVDDIPDNVYFFIPILNTVHWIPEDGPDLATVRAAAAADIDALLADPGSFLQLTVDGVSLSDADLRSNFRAAGDGVLTFDCPGNLGCGFVPSFEDRVGAADGVWVALEPLPPGRHIVRIVAKSPLNDFNVDVTYDLYIGPKPPSAMEITRTGESTFELSWTGGDGTNNIEGSVDGTTWSPIVSGVASPQTVTVDLNTTPVQFFRVIEP